MTTGTTATPTPDITTWTPGPWATTARTLAVGGGVLSALAWLLVNVGIEDGTVGPAALLAIGVSVALTVYSGAMVAVAWFVRVTAAAVAEVDRQARARAAEAASPATD